MKLSYLDLYRKLHDQSLNIRPLTALLEKNDMTIMDQFKDWLNTTEDLLRRNKFTESNVIAGYRGQLIASQLAFDRRVPKKKRQLAVASELIEPASKTVIDVMKPLENNIATSRKMIKGMLSTAYELRLIEWNNGLLFSEFIPAIWRMFQQHRAFNTSAEKILSLITEEDAIQLLADEVEIDIEYQL